MSNRNKTLFLSMIILSVFFINIICWGDGVIVFAVGSNIYMMHLNDAKPTLIEGSLGWFTPSPDGRFIADTGKNPKQTDILYIRNMRTGKKVRSIKLKVHNFNDISWSPDGRWIAYSGNTLGIEAGQNEDLELYLVSPDGQQHVRLFDQADQKPVGLVWTADSQSVFYNSAASKSRNEIWAININEKQNPKKHKPFHDQATFFSRYPFYSFSPNGEKIAYASMKEGIFVANINGTNHRKVVDNQNWELFFQVDWSPDGQYLVFSAQKRQDEHGLYVYVFATEKVQELIFTHENIPGWHQWVQDALAVHPTNKITTVWGEIKKLQDISTTNIN